MAGCEFPGTINRINEDGKLAVSGLIDAARESLRRVLARTSEERTSEASRMKMGDNELGMRSDESGARR